MGNGCSRGQRSQLWATVAGGCGQVVGNSMGLSCGQQVAGGCGQVVGNSVGLSWGQQVGRWVWAVVGVGVSNRIIIIIIYKLILRPFEKSSS